MHCLICRADGDDLLDDKTCGLLLNQQVIRSLLIQQQGRGAFSRICA